jgi:hypothetical protein
MSATLAKPVARPEMLCFKLFWVGLPNFSGGFPLRLAMIFLLVRFTLARGFSTMPA